MFLLLTLSPLFCLLSCGPFSEFLNSWLGPLYNGNRIVVRNNGVLKPLVLEIKKMYEADAEHRVNIYFADAHSSWRWTDSRTKRPLSSIVLNKGVKEMLLDDAKDFLRVCRFPSPFSFSSPLSWSGHLHMSFSFLLTICLTHFSVGEVVRNPWYSFPTRISITWRTRLRQDLANPLPRRCFGSGHLCRFALRFMDQ